MAGLILSLALLFVPVCVHAADAQDHILSGTKFASERKYKEAVREFRNAVKIDPSHPDANLLLGLALTNAGELEEAVQVTEKAVSLKPSYAGYYNLGIACANLERYAKAAEAYGKAVEMNPKSYQAWHQLGKVRSTALEFEKAIEAFGKAAQLNPKFPEAYQGLASAYYWTGDISSALTQVDELNRMGFAEKAKELERWIDDKESKKKKAAKRKAAAAPKEAPAQAPKAPAPQA